MNDYCTAPIPAYPHGIRKPFDHMTPTAKALIGSPNFWMKRIEEQVDYIIRYQHESKSRPDALAVKESAIDILEQCQINAIKAAPTAFEKAIVSAVIAEEAKLLKAFTKDDIGGAQQPPRTNGKEV